MDHVLARSRLPHAEREGYIGAPITIHMNARNKNADGPWCYRIVCFHLSEIVVL
jgi:hypothetical protein